jgi:hypothetical protein
MPSSDLTALGYAFGRLAGATRFASPEIRRVASLATVAGAWRAYRRDAGAGDVGSAHQPSSDPGSILMTDDLRRDAVALWLAANGVPAIAEAATTIVRMVNATRGFEADELALLNVAQDAVAQVPAGGPLTRACGLANLGLDHPLQGLARATAAVDSLITTADFAEGHGHDAILPLPSRSMRHYIAAEPAGCWALNLTLAARGVVPSVMGVIPRTAFRLDLDDVERSTTLIDHSNHATLASFKDLERIETLLKRGREALAGLSRNARAGEAWALAVAFGPIRRAHITRGLGLSRAGADIQVHALAAAELVKLETGGLLAPALSSSSSSLLASLGHGPLSDAATDLDLAMAEIDRLLSIRSSAG